MVTVYRSMDASAEADCQIVLDMLAQDEIQGVLLDDSSPGVPEGAYEVRVPAAELSRAEGIIAANPLPEDEEVVDDSHQLDLETIYHAEGSVVAEVESSAIMAVLEANDIMAVTTGDSVLPQMPVDIKVAKEQAGHARQVLEDARQQGPAAAEEAERQTEPTAE